MAIKAFKMIDGTLTIGSAPLDVSCQVTACTLEAAENVTTEDALQTLCGDKLPASDTVDLTWTLSGTMLQDLFTGGIFDYSYAHASEEVAFVFTPDNTLAATFTGVVRPIPLTVGGDVGSRPTSDFTWAVIGTPTPVWAVAA